jgi:uncharacterized membrane protein YfcA
MMQELVLLGSGLIAGFLDSIAGGGGLITLPVLSLVLEPGAHAIGTNKIVGTTGALLALFVYARKGHFRWKEGLSFVLWVGLGSSVGSRVTPLLPVELFRWLLIGVSPVILYFVWNRERWLRFETQVRPQGQRWWSFGFAATGFACGFYDGAFGPGGGTFMLLGLLYVVQLPLLQALAVSKLANTLSASVAWATYGMQGYVHTEIGVWMAIGMGSGALLGSTLATKKASSIVRPVLTVVVVILMTKLAWDAFVGV